MKTSGKSDEPSKQPAAPGRGAPFTYAASATRKDLLVRVRVTQTGGDPDELREHGYGHGV